MTLGNPVFITAALVVTGASLASSAGATLEELKAPREASLKQIRENCRVDVEKLSNQLLGALERGRDAAKAAGDEELAKSYDTEVELIKLVGEPPELQSSVPGITKLQTIYKTSREERYGRMYQAVVVWQKAYDAELDALGKKLLSSNQTEAAELVAAEREKLRSNELVTQAIEAVESTSTPTETAPTGSEKGGTKPWFSLVKTKWADMDGSQYFLGMIKERGQIEIGGKKYQKGRDLIYTHAPGRIVYQFPSPVSEFRATGCLEERSGNGNVVFIVETADGEVYRGQPVKKDRNQEKIEIKFKPSTKLVIKVDENGGAAEDWSFLLEPEYR